MSSKSDHLSPSVQLSNLVNLAYGSIRLARDASFSAGRELLRAIRGHCRRSLWAQPVLESETHHVHSVIAALQQLLVYMCACPTGRATLNVWIRMAGRRGRKRRHRSHQYTSLRSARMPWHSADFTFAKLCQSRNLFHYVRMPSRPSLGSLVQQSHICATFSTSDFMKCREAWQPCSCVATNRSTNSKGAQ